MVKEEKRGRPFERLVAAVQAKLDPGAQVHSPLRVQQTRSGVPAELDAAVKGKVGSTEILVAIEAKDYREDVGVEKVRAFASLLKDIRAHKGIMVAQAGFTGGALSVAANEGIETCVLRAANDDDWQGYLRSVKLEVVMMAPLYRDASFTLADGRTFPVDEGGIKLFADQHGHPVFFDEIVNDGLFVRPELEGKAIEVSIREPIWYEDDGSKTAVIELRCRRQYVEEDSLKVLHTAPEDWVFVKQTPEGALDEKTFFQLKELERLAEKFRRLKRT